MYRSIKHTHRWPLKSHLYWQFGSIRAAKIHQMTYSCVCAHSGVLIARVYTRPGCPCIRVQLTRLSEQQPDDQNSDLCGSRKVSHVVASTLSLPRYRFLVIASLLSLPRYRFLVIASTLSLSGILRDFNQHGGHVLLEFFVIFSYLISLGCCVFPGFLFSTNAGI